MKTPISWDTQEAAKQIKECSVCDSYCFNSNELCDVDILCNG